MKISFTQSPEALGPDSIEVNRHLATCDACRDFIAQEKLFASLLKDKFKKETIPGELLERISKKNKARKFPYRKVYYAIAVAASVLLIAILGHKLIKKDTLISDIVDDHIQFHQMSDIQIESSSPDEIKRWFMGKVDFPVNVAQISARLRGGRLCFLDKQRLALLFYEYKGSQISLFMTRNMDMKRLRTGKEVTVNGKKLNVVEDRGYNLFLWDDKGVISILVSELGIDEIKQII